MAYVCTCNFVDGSKDADGNRIRFKAGDAYIGSFEEQALKAGLIKPSQAPKAEPVKKLEESPKAEHKKAKKEKSEKHSSEKA